MKIVTNVILVATCGLLLGAVPPPGNPAIALVSKVILDVTSKEVGKDWQPTKRGETLSSGERVKTGERSIAIIKFKDNSMLRVREKSEVVVHGLHEKNIFSKSTDLERGVIGFNIKKQQKGEEFRFSSPTSVASIRGTTGQFGAEDTVDKLIVLEGLVRLMNKVSAHALDIEAGFTGISFRDGKIERRQSTPEEKLAAELAARLGDKENRLDLELNDGKGNKKQLEIKFK
ncbi:MAG: FecR domain-containing protein [Ignavibacteriae bacterium]|nr:FecR domain-containing protein [Ignavibacteriota bacterium]